MREKGKSRSYYQTFLIRLAKSFFVLSYATHVRFGKCLQIALLTNHNLKLTGICLARLLELPLRHQQRLRCNVLVDDTGKSYLQTLGRDARCVPVFVIHYYAEKLLTSKATLRLLEEKYFHLNLEVIQHIEMLITLNHLVTLE